MASDLSFERQLLERSYFKLKNEVSLYTRTQILYNIILIKADVNDPGFYKYKQTFYLDVKYFIEAYTGSVSLQAYGYDFIDLGKIFKLYLFLSLPEALAINKYLTRILRASGYQDEVNICYKEASKLEMALCKQSKSPLYFGKYLLYITSKNLRSLLTSVGIILFLFALILLPAPLRTFQFFELTYEDFSSNFFVNHFLNLLYGGMDLSSVFNIAPMNPIAVVLLVIGKFIMVVIVGNYLIQEIVRKVTE